MLNSKVRFLWMKMTRGTINVRSIRVIAWGYYPVFCALLL
jgi:hypothetical protein